MNPAKFLKQFEQDVDRDRLVDVIYDEFALYCRENNISVDDISNDELEQLAEAYVARGFNVEPESIESVNEDWRDSHGLRWTLGFERSSNFGSGSGNTYRFAVRDSDGWRYIDCESTLPVRSLQNRL